MKILAAPLLLALLPLTTLIAPNTPPQDQANAWVQAAVAKGIAENTPQVFFYEPKNASPYDLYEVAAQLYGRALLIMDEFGEREAENLMVLGDDRLLVFDFPEQAQEVLALFEKLDVPSEFIEPPQAPQLVTADYKPRHIGLDDLALALAPFSYPLENGLSSITQMRAANLLILRDTSERIDEMKSLLQRIDIPAKQVELTCYVLQASNDPEATADKLPPELTSGLIELLPFYNFELSTMGVLRLSTAAGSQAELDMQLLDSDSNSSYRLQLRVNAFDPDTQNLSLTGLESGVVGPTGYTSLFRTDASIFGDEYAVMGATGAEPTFVVLHFKPIG